MQVVKTPEHIKESQAEQSGGGAERDHGATSIDDLLRIVQLIGRHGFALAHFARNCSGTAYLVAYRIKGPSLEPPHVYTSKDSEHQGQRKRDDRHKTKQSRFQLLRSFASPRTQFPR